MPSGTKLDPASLAARSAGAAAGAGLGSTRSSAAGVRSSGLIANTATAASAASAMVRISALFAMSRVLSWDSLRCDRRRHAEPDRDDLVAARVARICCLGMLGLGGVDQAAQGERQRTGPARRRQELSLRLRHLEGRGPADDDLLAVLLLNELIDGEHAHVGQDRLADIRLDSRGLLGLAVATRQDHVDAVIRQNEG